MEDDELQQFNDYLLSKKLQLLYCLQERLYSFAKRLRCTNNKYYNITLDATFDRWMLEIRGSELLDINERLKLHSKLYKIFKPHIDVKLGNNGQQVFWESLEELYGIECEA